MNDFETARQQFVEGLKLLEANNVEGAELKLGQSLEALPDRVSTLNNLSVVKMRLDKFAEAEELAKKAIAVDEKSPEAWSNRGIALMAMKRQEEALQAYERALQCNPSFAGAWLNKAMALFELKKFDQALAACDMAQKFSYNQYEVLFTKSRILKELRQSEEANKLYMMSIEAQATLTPVYISDRHASQRADILIISQNPILDGSLKSFEILHRTCHNYPGQLAMKLEGDFHFSFVFERNATRQSARKLIPQPDVLINNCANGELLLSDCKLPNLTEVIDSFGVPVVNHPQKAVQTTRDATVSLLSGIPGIVAPKTVRFSSKGKTPEEMVKEIEEQFDYPLITRTLVSQEGKGMGKMDSREALLAELSSNFSGDFFVTQFIDSRRGKEFFRKIRAAVVMDEIIIGRADFDFNWNVHGRKKPGRVPFYLERPFLLEEEKQICSDPEAALGRSAIEALRTIRDRIPLDVFGIDFEVDADGLLVFYEANATMNLLSTAAPEVPNPKESDDRLREAFRSYLESLAAGRDMKPDDGIIE
jgi:glutathione synthase/RimK-type ligase-like ATP-grasp enzyme/predicted negative regulator of RcsB-dependent stress response